MTTELPIVTRLRKHAYNDSECSELAAEVHIATVAAVLISEMQLAGFAVWNNVMEGDIEAHTEQASNALQMLRQALAKATTHER